MAASRTGDIGGGAGGGLLLASRAAGRPSPPEDCASSVRRLRSVRLTPDRWKRLTLRRTSPRLRKDVPQEGVPKEVIDSLGERVPRAVLAYDDRVEALFSAPTTDYQPSQESQENLAAPSQDQHAEEAAPETSKQGAPGNSRQAAERTKEETRDTGKAADKHHGLNGERSEMVLEPGKQLQEDEVAECQKQIQKQPNAKDGSCGKRSNTGKRARSKAGGHRSSTASEETPSQTEHGRGRNESAEPTKVDKRQNRCGNAPRPTSTDAKSSQQATHKCYDHECHLSAEPQAAAATTQPSQTAPDAYKSVAHHSENHQQPVPVSSSEQPHSSADPDHHRAPDRLTPGPQNRTQAREAVGQEGRQKTPASGGCHCSTAASAAAAAVSTAALQGAGNITAAPGSSSKAAVPPSAGINAMETPKRPAHQLNNCVFQRPTRPVSELKRGPPDDRWQAPTAPPRKRAISKPVVSSTDEVWRSEDNLVEGSISDKLRRVELWLEQCHSVADPMEKRAMERTPSPQPLPRSSASARPAAPSTTRSVMSSRGRPRRRRIEYTKEEVQNLLHGVRTYGRDFKAIRLVYQFHPARTTVDLYDKYRHMIAQQNANQDTPGSLPA